MTRSVVAATHQPATLPFNRVAGHAAAALKPVVACRLMSDLATMPSIAGGARPTEKCISAAIAGRSKESKEVTTRSAAFRSRTGLKLTPPGTSFSANSVK